MSYFKHLEFRQQVLCHRNLIFLTFSSLVQVGNSFSSRSHGLLSHENSCGAYVWQCRTRTKASSIACVCYPL